MITNRLGLPAPFVDAATSSHRYTPKRYSVSDLLGGTCEAVLKRRYEGQDESDVSDMVWAIFGTAVHKVLQEAEATESQLQENKLVIPIDVDGEQYELSGIFDLYDAEEHCVTDYKTCSVWKTQVGDFEDWRKQTLIYCWMLRQLGFEADKGEIVAIMRDHSMRKARYEKGYPPHPVMRIAWSFTEEDFEKAGEFVKKWFAYAAFDEQVPDDMLSPCPDTWHKPDTWAVIGDGRKKAKRVFESAREADSFIEGLGEGYRIEYRQGEDTKCQYYCSVARFCLHGRKYFQEFPDSQEL